MTDINTNTIRTGTDGGGSPKALNLSTSGEKGKITVMQSINFKFLRKHADWQPLADLGDFTENYAPTWTVGDSAARTGGFLVSAVEHLMQRYTSEKGKIEECVISENQITYSGDSLSSEERKQIATKMLHGFYFDVTLLHIASMDLMFHGVDTPTIHYQAKLSNSFSERFPKLASEVLDLILANLPLKDCLDYGDVYSSILKLVNTKKTEMFFTDPSNTQWKRLLNSMRRQFRRKL